VVYRAFYGKGGLWGLAVCGVLRSSRCGKPFEAAVQAGAPALRPDTQDRHPESAKLSSGLDAKACATLW
jgi:hypothetical protein